MFGQGNAHCMNSHSPRRSASFRRYTDTFRINCSDASKIHISTCFWCNGTASKIIRSAFANRLNINVGGPFFITFMTLFPRLNTSRQCLRALAEQSFPNRARLVAKVTMAGAGRYSPQVRQMRPQLKQRARGVGGTRASCAYANRCAQTPRWLRHVGRATREGRHERAAGDDGCGGVPGRRERWRGAADGVGS